MNEIVSKLLSIEAKRTGLFLNPASETNVLISKLHSIEVKRTGLLQNFAISKRNERNYLKTSQYQSKTNKISITSAISKQNERYIKSIVHTVKSANVGIGH
jgi:hypothetical protein